MRLGFSQVDVFSIEAFRGNPVAVVHDADARRAVGADIEVRAFVPGDGIPEDPVTGSLNAGLAQWLTGAGLLPPDYTAAQGTVLGRTGRITIRTDGETVWVGGPAVPVVRGTVVVG